MLSFGLALALTAPGVQAQPAEDAAELAELLDMLADETEIATRTRQNADFVPGIVSVLRGEELRLLGAQTVLDALALVPGIEINRDGVGNGTLRVRGLDFFFNTGNTKVLLNGLDAPYQVSGQNSTLLLLPLLQVDRIEIIRGPGASVHGDFAFTGLINIVTRTDRSSASATLGSGGMRALGARLVHQGDWTYSLDVSGYSSDRHDAPNQEQADERRRYAMLQLSRAGFALKANLLDRSHDRAPRTQIDEELQALELRHDWRFEGENRAGLWLGRANVEGNSGPRFQGHRNSIGADAVWRFGRHLLLAQASWAGFSIENGRLPPAPPGQPSPFRRPAVVSDHLPGWALLLEDQHELTDSLTVIAGLRYDRQVDLASRATPRFAAVWRLAPRHTLKAQYAEGFRLPNLVELFDSGLPNPRLRFEAVATRELGYHYRNEQRQFRINLFGTRIHDLIRPGGPPGAGFTNAGFISARGIELEAVEAVGASFKLIGNLSLVHTEDSRVAQGPGAPPTVVGFGTPTVLGNLGLLWTPDGAWRAGLHWNHVGTRQTQRRDIDGYDAVNLAVEYLPRAVENLRLRAGLRNALESDINYTIARPPANLAEELAYDARRWFVEVEWAFD